jgi:iron complex transport system permease protein
MQHFSWAKFGVLLSLVVLLLLVSVWSLLTGEFDITCSQLIGFVHCPKGMEYDVLVHLRLPRLLLAIAVGGSLSLSGVILQGLYRNPLVEPYTLGISGGASLGVAGMIVTGAVFSFGSILLPIAGFVGALITIFLVYFLGMGRGTASVNRMLLTGVMISFVCSSLLLFLLSISTTESLHSIIFWTMGSLEEPDETLIAVMLIGSLLVLVVTHFFAAHLNALRLGRDEAHHLGVSVDRTVRVLFVMTSLLTGLCVSIAGIIGFVGLVVPHVLRRILGSDFRLLLSASFIGGALFLLVCDVLARTLIAPNELPVGVLTGICGGILFIVLLSKKGKEWQK